MNSFESFLAPQLNDYLAYRTSLGYKMGPTRYFLKTFDRYLKNKTAQAVELKPAFFLELRADLDLESRTINRVISAVRGFFGYLVRLGLYRSNPVKDITLLPENRLIPFIFTPHQTDQLLQAVVKRIRKSPTYFIRDLSSYIALMLIARLGLRISEPLSMMRSHYRPDEKTLYIEQSKFKKDRLIPVPRLVALELDNYLIVRQTLQKYEYNPFLLVRSDRHGLCGNTVRLIFKRAVKDIGLDQPRRVIGNTNFSAPVIHSLRHSFATNTLKRIKDSGRCPQNALPILAAFMGHSDYKHTVKYLKMIDAGQRQRLLDFVMSQKQKR